VVGAALALFVLAFVLSACGSAPVPQSWPGLTVADDTVYVLSGLPWQVYMLDTENGSQRATFMPDGEFAGVLYWSPVTLGEGVAFVGFAEEGNGVARLYAFDPANGQELWYVQAQDLILDAPAYADGVVYFGDSAGFVYAVDLETQAVKPGWPFEVGEAIWASPLVVGDRVYVACMDHNIYALDAETGEEVWTTHIGAAMAASPALDEAQGVLYVGAFDGRVHALDADSGERLEDFDFQAGNWIWSQPLLADDVLYVTSLDGRLYALDRESGAVVPPYPYDAAELTDSTESLRAAPVDAGASIVVATESGRIIAVDNAQRQWDWPGGLPEAQIYTTPVMVDGAVYVVLVNGQVQALDAENGNPKWSFSPPDGE
jgi:outer membrane protein assembly factor BamB